MLTQPSSTTAAPVVVAVLAGGKSLRMGRDKASIQLSGVTMLERVCDAAFALELPVIVVGRSNSQLPVRLQATVHALLDDTPGLGPMGGLATALRFAHSCSILLCATDIPFVRPETFRWLLSHAGAAIDDQHHGIVPTWNGQAEPIFALYHQQALPIVEALMACNNLSMRSLIKAGNFRLVSLPEANKDAITDVDTPADLDKLPSYLQ